MHVPEAADPDKERRDEMQHALVLRAVRVEGERIPVKGRAAALRRRCSLQDARELAAARVWPVCGHAGARAALRRGRDAIVEPLCCHVRLGRHAVGLRIHFAEGQAFGRLSSRERAQQPAGVRRARERARAAFRRPRACEQGVRDGSGYGCHAPQGWTRAQGQ